MVSPTDGVKVLNLRGNPIKELAFQSVGFLQGLDLSNCSLDKIPLNGPFVYTNLERINLNSNNLTSLSWKEFLTTHSLTNVSLTDNPWICDCQIQFLRDYLIRAREFDISDEVICDSPPELKGRGLRSIPRNEVLPCPLKNGKLIGIASEDKITVRCLTEGVPEPVIE